LRIAPYVDHIIHRTGSGPYPLLQAV